MRLHKRPDANRPRILTKEKIASLNDNDLSTYKKCVGESLKLHRRRAVAGAPPELQKLINAYTYAFRESERETERRDGID